MAAIENGTCQIWPYAVEPAANSPLLILASIEDNAVVAVIYKHQ
jgi:hypothetical protein